ncbi:hypothetical protein CRM93_14545, partial [Acetobacter fabarum]
GFRGHKNGVNNTVYHHIILFLGLSRHFRDYIPFIYFFSWIMYFLVLYLFKCFFVVFATSIMVALPFEL